MFTQLARPSWRSVPSRGSAVRGCQSRATSRLAAGMAGRMYPGSLVAAAEKKATIKTSHSSRIAGRARASGWRARASGQGAARAIAWGRNGDQGNSSSTSQGR